MHLDDESIQRFLHGELSGGDQATTGAHLDTCPECTQRLAEAAEEEARMFSLLERLDHPSPGISLADLPRRPAVRRARRLRWAAGIIGAFGVSTVAYAAPGSPVPGWVHRLVGRMAPAPTTPDSTSPGPEGGAFPAGVSVAPGPHFTVVFSPSGWAGTVIVSVEAVPEVSVEAEGTEAAFTMDTGLLLVEARGRSGAFRVRIPVDAPRVDLRLAGETLFSKIGATVSTAFPQDDQGTYRLEIRPTVRRP